MIVTEPQHELVFGSVDLISRFQTEDYVIETLSEGTDFGTPAPIEVALRSLLQDGSIVVTQGYDNREVALRVVISAEDSAALTEGEAALFAEVGKMNTLTWTPPDMFGAPTVFDVVTSRLGFVFDDTDELRLRRTFTLTLVCLPFGRSDTEIVTPAVERPSDGGGTPITPITVTVADGTSLTGWKGASTPASNPVLDVTSFTQVRTLYSDVAGLMFSPIQTSDTNMVLVDWVVTAKSGAPGYGVTFDWQPASASTSGPWTPAVLLSTESAPAPGVTRSTLEINTPGPIRLRVTAARWSGRTVSGSKNYILRIDNVIRANQPPVVGTPRQKFRSVDVLGSARTQGSLEISHDTDALGEVLAYTYRDDQSGYTPPLRRYLTSSGVVTGDTALVSGGRNNLDTPMVCDIPVGALPDGNYLLMARVRSDVVSTQGITWTVQVFFGSQAVGAKISGSTLVTFTNARTWQYVVLGNEMLPPTRTDPNADAVVRVTLSAGDPAVSDIDLDDAWLFNLTLGALTQVSCGTGTPAPGGPSSRLWINAATSTDPRPSIRRGTLEDGSDSFHAGADTSSWGVHDFIPPSVNVFTVSDAVDAATALRHHPRWFGNAQRLA